MSKFTSLDLILNKDVQELTALQEGEFHTEKIGTIPFTALDHAEYKQAKKDCFKMVRAADEKGRKGKMVPDLDDDLLMVRVIIAAVNKDKRSDFTFANKQLLEKLGVATADAVVSKLLSPGEIVNFAMDIQELSGFGDGAEEELEEEVKNS